MVFPKLIDGLISLYGWRGAYLALAGLVALTILPVAAALFRDRPEKFGLSTDAGLPPAAEDQREEPSFTREQALRSGVFWLLCAAGFLTNAIGTALLLNHFSIMQTAGIAHSDALLLLSLLAGVQAAATLGTGFLVDRYEPRRLVPLAMLMLALASGLPAFGSGIAISVLYALSLGGAYGSQQAINAAGYAQYFGRDHLGAIRGASFVFGIAGAAFGPLPFAASVDWTGSYAAVLIGCCGLCLAIGAIAMLSQKRRGRHSKFGTIYFWLLLALFASATFLSLMRWDENYHLFILGALSFACAWFGRSALRHRWGYWIRLHIAGMALSYILMLVAFYVDNGKQLPLWKDLPHFMYWLIPIAVGIPFIVRALLWPPLAA